MIRALAASATLLLFLVPCAAGSDAPLGQQQVERAAREFGEALVRSDVTELPAVLPRQGRIRMELVRFGPEEGSFGAGQVQALFKDFLRHGAVRSFAIVRTDCSSDSFALVRCRAAVTDRDGRRADVDLHLTFQPEDGHWVLREIREKPP